MKNTIIVVIIIFNLCIVAVGLKNLVNSDYLKSMVNTLQTDLKNQKDALVKEQNNSRELQGKFTELETVKKKVQQELEQKKTEAGDLAKELAQEKLKRKNLEKQLQTAEKEISTLKLQVKEEKDKSQDLEKRLERMANRLEKQEDDKQSILTRLDSATKEREELQNQLKKMSEQDVKYSLSEITVSEQKVYSGIVLNINEKFNFCIISIGKNEEIVPGITLIVHRGSKLIGKVVVEKVFDKMSSAKIASLSENEMIQIEDSVRKF